MVAHQRLICATADLEEAGRGVRFEVVRHGRPEPAFVIRYGGRPRAFLNRCGHVPAEMDFLPGEFFDHSRLYLICSVHGAFYAPDTGRCLGGRCNGQGLVPLAVKEVDGAIYLEE
jgi:nitrite reductase/ring-hydroxylating ferredoxin subunit